MKLTMIGCGIRTPLAIPPILRRAQQMGLQELCLMDIDAEKLHNFGMLARHVARSQGSALTITLTTDAHAALDGARFVITTIRVGGDQGRVLDERIALRHGVLGQETTGAGGFAMALRSIPAILHYAELLEEVSPGAWLLNFTNPAGLVTQALRDRGFARTVGICDSANGAQSAVANWLRVDARRLRAEVFGLNHLSWARAVMLDGEDVLAPLLRNPDFQRGTMLRLFDPKLIESLGMWLNEYLFYWYCSRQALEAVQSEALSRGEAIQAWNRELLARLRSVDIERDPQAALDHYHAYIERRAATYMTYGEGGERKDNAPLAADEEEGYMGVALDTILSLSNGQPLHTALNVPNRGAIACMQPDDVVEVSCLVDGDGVHPLPIGAVPEHQELLMRIVKLYEKLTVQAILTRSRATAAEALMVHPLVFSYPLARTLVDEYLQAHADYVGTWH